MAADQILGNAQPQSRAVGAARHQRIEDRVADRSRYAGTVVLELDGGDQAVARRAQKRVGAARVRSTRRGARFAAAAASACSALRPRFSIAWMMWSGSTVTRRQARIVVAVDQHAGGRLAAQQVVDALEHLVHVDLLLRRRAARARAWSRAASVSRSASLMMTLRVFALRLGSSSSRSSSCAAPRRPPSGFLISCASWRTIRRLPPSCASSAFSRVRRRCRVMSSISSSSRPMS